MAQRARVGALDIAKGIAIIAVLVGHTRTMDTPDALIRFCFTFHMPLFFIVSGYFFKVPQTIDRSFVMKNARALLLPYLYTCLAVVVLAFARCLVLGEPAQGIADACAWVVAALYGAGSYVGGLPEYVQPIGAVWFLLALFWGKLLLAAVNRAPGTPWVVAGMFAAGYLIGSDNVWLPFGVQPALSAVLFMYVGQKFREHGVLEKGAVPPVLVAVALGVWLYCVAFEGDLYIVVNLYGNVVLDVLGGIAGSYCVLKLSQWLEGHVRAVAEPLRRLGCITLPVFCMHLVELDAFPWGYAADALAASAVPMWIGMLVFRFALVAVLTALLYITPRPISGVFFASRKQRTEHA